jgi:hypothetical protein
LRRARFRPRISSKQTGVELVGHQTMKLPPLRAQLSADGVIVKLAAAIALAL